MDINIEFFKKFYIYFKKNFMYRESTSLTQSKRLPQLDGLRGVAALLVISSHTSAFGMYGQGGLGVLIFFVLSGFVLTLPYAKNPNELISYHTLTKFLLNRILRIMPAFIIAVIAISWKIDTSIKWIFLNIITYKCWSHFWSVAQELRFYILFPVIMWILGISSSYIIRFLASGVIIWVSYKYGSLYIVYRMELYPSGDPFYFWIFLGGVITAMFYTSLAAKNLSSNKVFCFILNKISFFIFISFFMTSNYIVNNFWRFLFPQLPKELTFYAWTVPELWCLLIILFLLSISLSKNGLINYILCSWPLRHIGLLSYSLYLFHVQIIEELNHHEFTNEKLFIVVFAITYLLSLISYNFIEKPFLNLKKFF